MIIFQEDRKEFVWMGLEMFFAKKINNNNNNNGAIPIISERVNASLRKQR